MRYYSDTEALEQLKARSKSFTESRFGWDAVVDRYVSILQNLSS
jgi:hypothetical protein